MTSSAIRHFDRSERTSQPEDIDAFSHAVFVGGSRGITRLDASVRSTLDRIIRKGHAVLVGDAYGADRAVQSHLAYRHAEQVIVYAIDGHLRNRLAAWPVRLVQPPLGARGFDLYSAKDRVMGRAATSGLMLWDGASRGTLANIRDLVAQRKPVVVFLVREARSVIVNSQVELRELLSATRATAARR